MYILHVYVYMYLHSKGWNIALHVKQGSLDVKNHKNKKEPTRVEIRLQMVCVESFSG